MCLMIFEKYFAIYWEPVSRRTLYEWHRSIILYKIYFICCEFRFQFHDIITVRMFIVLFGVVLSNSARILLKSNTLAQKQYWSQKDYILSLSATRWHIFNDFIIFPFLGIMTLLDSFGMLCMDILVCAQDELSNCEMLTE